MPTHLFRHYHSGFDVAGWQAHEKMVASDVADYEKDYMADKSRAAQGP